ncbi:MAG: peptide deformylase [Candidatus Riflebacteria bacterium]|nr:peptide deformylase [Candidatus Riflebacteria bacterium]
MAHRPILRYPAPELRQRCELVLGGSELLSTLIQDLLEMMDALPGCVGLAAPQVGALLRVVVVDASRYRKKVENQGRMVLINPVQQNASGQKVFREGCLSLPDLTGNVPRATSVEYLALDERLESRPIRASGFEAVVLQHEIDHLDGVLFIDRVVCAKTDLFRRQNYL